MHRVPGQRRPLDRAGPGARCAARAGPVSGAGPRRQRERHQAFLAHVVGLGLQFSVGIGTNIGVDRELLALLPTRAWTPAYNSDGQPREGAQVAELSGLLPELISRGWPAGMRVLARREHPHPGERSCA